MLQRRIAAATLACFAFAALADVPAKQQAKGVASASVTLAAQPAPLTAQLRAIAHATVGDGGWIEVRLFADDKECMLERVDRISPMGPNFTVDMVCKAELARGVPHKLRAEQKVNKGKLLDIELQAEFKAPK